MKASTLRRGWRPTLLEDIIPMVDATFRTRADQSHRATAHNGVMANAKEFNRKMKLIFQSCGSRERPENLKASSEQLKAAGINTVMYVSPETAHEWQTWRRSLHEFAPLLFRN
jgi:S-formylglutathione hydrolase FrmB